MTLCYALGVQQTQTNSSTTHTLKPSQPIEPSRLVSVFLKIAVLPFTPEGPFFDVINERQSGEPCHEKYNPLAPGGSWSKLLRRDLT